MLASWFPTCTALIKVGGVIGVITLIGDDQEDSSLSLKARIL